MTKHSFYESYFLAPATRSAEGDRSLVRSQRDSRKYLFKKDFTLSTLPTFLPDEKLLEAAVDDGVRGVVSVYHLLLEKNIKKIDTNIKYNLVVGLTPTVTAANLHNQLSSSVIAGEPGTSPHTLITFSS